MSFKRFFMFASLASLFSVQSSGKTPTADYLKYLNNSVSFFNRFAFDEEMGTYFSEVDNVGRAVSQKIHTVALSRMIYGLAYSSQYYPENLIRAKLAAQFQLKYLIGVDSVGKYFIPTIENGVVEVNDNLDIWQQAYGLCGLSELFRITQDEALLKTIHELHDAFIIRFRDSANGGFFGNYSMTRGQQTGSKTLQSLIYPITAYMANLWSADVKHRYKYKDIIKEHLHIAYNRVWNTKIGWVNVSFNDNWSVSSNNILVTPGHNFQYASLLLRARQWDFLTSQEVENYTDLGNKIISITLQKPIWHKQSLKNGFYSEVNIETGSVVSDVRTWWQHCEAIIALSLAKEKFSTELNLMTEFYFANFSDMEKGGDFFYIDKFDRPITSELKGSKGKSIYHVVEMIRFLMED